MRVNPSGAQITVVEPFNNTVAPSCRAVCWAKRRRCPSTLLRSFGSSPSTRVSSPACGVRIVGADRRATISGSRPTMVNASASITTGTSDLNTCASRCSAYASVPIPGPTTHACTRPTPSTSSSGSPLRTVTTASGQRARTSSAGCATETNRTMPAPARSAPPVASTAAPVYVSLPATMPSTPRWYLSDSDDGNGSRAPTSPACKAVTDAIGRSGASPMSTNSTAPACCAPGSISRPGFQVPNVTVTCACTATPSTSPVSASTPLGRSTATTVGVGPIAPHRGHRLGSQAATRTDADDAVENEVGGRECGGVADPTTGSAQRSEATGDARATRAARR